MSGRKIKPVSKRRFNLDRFYRNFLKECHERRGNVTQTRNDIIRALQNDRSVPGLGTWADLYAVEFPNDPLPEKCPLGWVPSGLSYGNLRRVWDRHTTEASHALLQKFKKMAGLQ